MSTSKIDESELLARFGQLAPAEWGVKRFGNEASIRVDNGWLVFQLDDDIFSAEALIFLWDYLARVDYSLDRRQPGSISLDPAIYYDSPKSWSVIFVAFDPDDIYPIKRAYSGKTRIEAVIRACVALWEADHEGKNLDSNSTQASAVSVSKEEINGH